MILFKFCENVVLFCFYKPKNYAIIVQSFNNIVFFYEYYVGIPIKKKENLNSVKGLELSICGIENNRYIRSILIAWIW